MGGANSKRCLNNRRMIPWSRLSNEDREDFEQPFNAYKDVTFPMLDNNTIFLAKFKRDVDISLSIDQFEKIVNGKDVVISKEKGTVVLEEQEYSVWGYVRVTS
jgi:hypothetical protein